MTAKHQPELAAVVVHWHGEDDIADLVASWPRDARFELIVVDNSASLGELPEPARLVVPEKNLGFGGGVNHGVAATTAPWILILNPDVQVQADALDHLLTAVADFPGTAGIVPALESPDGGSQCRWQLQPLPAPSTLVLQTLFLAGERGPDTEPPRGTAIEQPAAAALLLRRPVLEELGGFDDGYYPAWFEDVDVARRLQQGGHRLVFEPQARFVHGRGGSVPTLGYGPFLWVYYRNLCRYLRLHHGAGWSLIARGTLIKGMILRMILLPLRRPRRAPNRRAAAGALLDVIRGAVSNWHRPRSLATRFMTDSSQGGDA